MADEHGGDDAGTPIEFRPSAEAAVVPDGPRDLALVFLGASLVAGVGDEGAQAAAAHDVEGVATLALLDDERAAPVVPVNAAPGQRLDVFGGAAGRRHRPEFHLGELGQARGGCLLSPDRVALDRRQPAMHRAILCGAPD